MLLAPGKVLVSPEFIDADTLPDILKTWDYPGRAAADTASVSAGCTQSMDLRQCLDAVSRVGHRRKTAGTPHSCLEKLAVQANSGSV
jgi:hypothetical protein